MSEAAAVLASVATAAQQLLVQEPFFAHVLMRMRREVTDEVETAAVTVRDGVVTLLVNPRFWLRELTDDRHRVGVLKHEVLHVVLQHHARARSDMDRDRLNVAADLAVNCHIGLDDLPTGALRVDQPELLEAQDRRLGMTLEWYYDRLLPGPSSAALARFGRSGGQGSQWWGAACTPEGVAAARDTIRRAAAAVGARALSRLPEVVQEAIRTAGESDLARIDWRRAVRLFGASSRRTRIRNTLKRPSKRFGRVPGVRIQPCSHVVVAVDTSGSIGDDQLRAFFAEIHGLWRAGAEVTVIECDDEVRKVWAYRGAAPERCRGGGGTDFDPVIRWVNEHASRVDGLIYLTDGFGDRSVSCRKRVLWVVEGDRLGVEAMRSSIRATEQVVNLPSTGC